MQLLSFKPGRLAALATGLCLTLPTVRAVAVEPAVKLDETAAVSEVQPVSLFDAVRQGDGNAFNVLLFATAQWWLVHRYRTGENTSQALPLLAIGVQTTGDLIPLPPVPVPEEPAPEPEDVEPMPAASSSDAGEVEAVPEAGDDAGL